MFKLEINKSIIKVVEREPIASGGSKIYSVDFLFDGEWDGLIKTAVFKAGDSVVEVLLEESPIELPFEVLGSENVGKALWVGVLGSDESGIKLPAIWNQLGVIRAGTEHGKKAKKAEADVLAKVYGLAKDAQASAVSAEKYADESSAAAQAAESNSASARLYAETTAELASGILKVDIKAEQTDLGAKITVTDRTGAENTVNITPMGNANTVFANALRGNANGTVIRLDDVSPIVHSVGVKLSGEGDLSAARLYRYGKNLFDNSAEKIAEIDFLPGKMGQTVVLPAGRYTVSARGETSSYYIYTYLRAGGGGRKEPISGNKNIVTNEGPKSAVYEVEEGDVLYIYNGSGSETVQGNTAAIFAKYDIQIEVGEKSASFEEYIAPSEHAVSEDGAVEGVTSLSPTMTLMTDATGATIHCTYNRDINKAFEAITNAIISMGGNI